MVAHPDKTIDGDTCFATGECGIKQAIAILEIQQSGFQAEEHRGVIAERVVVDFA